MDKRALKIKEVLDKMYPDAYCELNFSNELELLIAVLLSAQTTDKSVNKLTKMLFKKYQSVDDYINADINELENDLRTIGLYKNKAKNIIKLANMLKNDFNKTIPHTREELERLPGVGRKTANVVLSCAFNVPTIAVDTHVERVAKRLKLAYKNDSVLKVEEKLMKKFPKEMWSKLHHQLIFFGRYHCKAINPNCNTCQLKELCRYPNINI
ncbi:endonuclease-3 [Bacilli bacterium PM5-3]|nr:endonuclease-3 [Bacilli bacterium PM5-3]MDH6603054.1 endonuclease-3 [Bacilli bacterium PM5-9]